MTSNLRPNHHHLRQTLLAWKILETISKTASLTKAALEMDMPLPSCSRIIKDLEMDLGQPLLNRKTKPIQLSSFAASIMPSVETMLESHQYILDAAIDRHSPDTRTKIRLSVSPGEMDTALFEFLKQYEQQCLHTEIELSTSKEEDLLLNGELDIVVGSIFREHPAIRHFHCGLGIFPIVASPSYIQSHGLPHSVDELERHRFILMKRGHYPLAEQLFRGNDIFDLRSPVLSSPQTTISCRQRVPLEKTIFTGSSYACLLWALQGKGIAVDLPPGYIREQLRSGQLVPVLPGWHRQPVRKMISIRVFDEERSDLMQFLLAFQTYEIQRNDQCWKHCYESLGIPLDNIIL